MDSENFCLNWNDFVKNVTSTFVELRRDKEFSDVTLACGDGQKIEAHKVVLASGSLVFKDLLKQSQNKGSPQHHPLIYMRVLKTFDLNPIVDFMYHGEVSVHQDKLNDFLALAEELQLKGLSGEGQHGPYTTEEKEQDQKQNGPFMASASRVARKQTRKPISAMKNEQALSLVDDGQVKPKVTFRGGTSELDKQIDSMMERIDKVWTCKVCGKKDRLNTNIKKHIEGVHLEGASYTCDLCGAIARSKNGLQSHIFRNHKS